MSDNQVTEPSETATPEMQEVRVSDINDLLDERDELITERDQLRAELAKAQEERDAASEECARLQALLDKDFDKATTLGIKMLHLDENGVKAHLQAEVVPLFGAMLASLFDAHGAQNYVEIEMSTPRHGPMVMTLQKLFGKTPHKLKTEAEEKLATLTAALDKAREDSKRLDWLLELIKQKGTDGLQSFPWTMVDDAKESDDDMDEDDPERLSPILDRAAIDAAKGAE